MKMDIQELLAKLDQADNEIIAAEEQYAAILLQIRENCKHEILLEAPQRFLEYFPSLPKLRICEVCGVEEEGPYYKILVGRAYPVKREGPDGLYSHRKRGSRTFAHEMVRSGLMETTHNAAIEV
jgi:hypothetical protein